jgi:hypothetical protein
MHTSPLRPVTKATAWKRKTWRFNGLALGVAASQLGIAG